MTGKKYLGVFPQLRTSLTEGLKCFADSIAVVFLQTEMHLAFGRGMIKFTLLVSSMALSKEYRVKNQALRLPIHLQTDPLSQGSRQGKFEQKEQNA